MTIGRYTYQRTGLPTLKLLTPSGHVFKTIGGQEFFDTMANIRMGERLYADDEDKLADYVDRLVRTYLPKE